MLYEVITDDKEGISDDLAANILKIYDPTENNKNDFGISLIKQLWFSRRFPTSKAVDDNSAAMEAFSLLVIFEFTIKDWIVSMKRNNFV